MNIRVYPQKKNIGQELRELYAYREFVASLVVRNLKVKYQGSILGLLWTLLNPLATVLVLTIVFTHIVRIEIHHYWAFLLSGYFVWHFFNQSVTAATHLLVEHAELSRSIAYPQEAPIIAGALSRLIEFVLELSLILVTLLLFHHEGRVPIGFLAVPWLVAILFVMALAVMFPLGTLSVYYRDVYHGLPLVMVTLFYITPVFYPADLVTGPLRTLYLCNPLVFLLGAFHRACYDGVLPPLTHLVGLSVLSVVALMIGYAFFNRFKASYAEIL